MTNFKSDDYKRTNSWFSYDGKEVVITAEHTLPANVAIFHAGSTGKCLISIEDAMGVPNLEVDLPYSINYLGTAGENLCNVGEIVYGPYINPGNDRIVEYGYILKEDAEHERYKQEICSLSSENPWENKAAQMKEAIVSLMREWRDTVNEYDDPFGTLTPLTFKELVVEANQLSMMRNSRFD